MFLQIIDDEVHEIENSVTVIDVQGPAEETTKFIPGEGSQDFIGLENHPNSAKLDSQESRSPKELGDEITKVTLFIRLYVHPGLAVLQYLIDSSLKGSPFSGLKLWNCSI